MDGSLGQIRAFQKIRYVGGKEKSTGARMQIARPREIAAVLRLKEGTVCSLASQGKLPEFKLGKSWRFDMGKIERLLAGTPRGGKERPEGNQQNIGEEGRRHE